MEPAPLWASSYTQYLLYKAQDPFSACRVQLFVNNNFSYCADNLVLGPVQALQIQKRRKRICRVVPAPLWAISYTQYLLYKAQDPFSACRVQLFLNNFFSYCDDNLVVGPVHASQIKKLRKRICRVEPAPLWASSCTQYLWYKAQNPLSACGVHLFLNNFFFSYCADTLVVGPVHASQIKKLRKRICRVEPAPLWASSYTQYLLYKFQDPFSACRVQLFLNNFFSYCADNLVVGPVHASQIKKLRKRICRMEPAPLWASSYTQYLLYKFQDPFSACRVQLFLNNFFSYCADNLVVGPVHASQIKKLRKRICRVEPAPLWASSYTHYPWYKPFSISILFSINHKKDKSK